MKLLRIVPYRFRTLLQVDGSVDRDAAPCIVAFFERFAPQDAERIGEFYIADAFRDPLRDICGVDDIATSQILQALTRTIAITYN